MKSISSRTTALRLLACALLLPTVPLVATAQGGAPVVPPPVPIVSVPKYTVDVAFAPGATGITAPQREGLGLRVSLLTMQCEAQNWYVDGYANAAEVKHPDGSDRLALDRASNVADLLVVYGVQRESICPVSRGSRHPAVQPLDIRNVRVEIMGIGDMRPVRRP